MVGASDSLQKPRGAFGCAHLHHAINVSPIDPKIETGCGDKRAQLPACHRSFDFAPRFPRQRSVMDTDGQLVFIRFPQILEYELCKEARVGKDQRGFVGFYPFIDLRDRPSRGMPAPRHSLFYWQKNLEIWLSPVLALNQRDLINIAPRRQPCAEGLRIGNRG